MAEQQKTRKAHIQRMKEFILRQENIRKDLSQSKLWLAVKRVEFSLFNPNIDVNEEDKEEIMKEMKEKQDMEEADEKLFFEEDCEKYEEQKFLEYTQQEDERAWFLFATDEEMAAIDENQIIHPTRSSDIFYDEEEEIWNEMKQEIEVDARVDEIIAFEEEMHKYEEESCVQHEEQENIFFVSFADKMEELIEKNELENRLAYFQHQCDMGDDDDTDLECPEDEALKIREEEHLIVLQNEIEQRIDEEMYYESVASEHDMDETDKILAVSTFEFEKKTVYDLTNEPSPKKRRKRGATHFTQKKKKREIYYASERYIDFSN